MAEQGDTPTTKPSERNASCESLLEEARQTYQGIVRSAEIDAHILGFVLGGSRGKGFGTEHSDFDCAMIVADGYREVYDARMRELPPLIDISVYTLQEFDEAHGVEAIARARAMKKTAKN